jgi:hypothetical protein
MPKRTAPITSKIMAIAKKRFISIILCKSTAYTQTSQQNKPPIFIYCIIHLNLIYYKAGRPPAAWEPTSTNHIPLPFKSIETTQTSHQQFLTPYQMKPKFAKKRPPKAQQAANIITVGKAHGYK